MIVVTVFLIVLCGVIISQSSSSLFRGETPWGYLLWPPFAFYRLLTVINGAAFTKSQVPYRMSMLVSGNEVYNGLCFMAVEAAIYLIIGAYLNTIVRSDYGVPLKWHWPLTLWLKQTMDPKLKIVDPQEIQWEDADVRAERDRVLGRKYPSNAPLIMKGMRKVYPKRRGAQPKIAVKDVTLAIEQGIVFGLLGPNGAGKTTLISILTGLAEKTSGQAWLGGLDVTLDRKWVYQLMGVCPQHDILWDDLTVEEHLLFYARLKGVSFDKEMEAVDESLAFVKLEPFRYRRSKGLSGGEKRRLSIAIALVGDPLIVFLDEPTTGLDPEVRRVIWNIINTAKVGKTIILTTHSMEEAEVLCQRIGIMAKGTLRCLGPQLRLKQVYGSGFQLNFVTEHEENMPKAMAFIESILPTNHKRIEHFSTIVCYEFYPQPGQLATLFETIESQKQAYAIADWGLSQTTLEDVFLKIISEEDAQAD
jgi:ABC-type multidrug transport system ATPase subunit